MRTGVLVHRDVERVIEAVFLGEVPEPASVEIVEVGVCFVEERFACFPVAQECFAEALHSFFDDVSAFLLLHRTAGLGSDRGEDAGGVPEELSKAAIADFCVAPVNGQQMPDVQRPPGHLRIELGRSIGGIHRVKGF